jgi:DNA-binding CsgD family transcriptional regulator
MLRARGAPRHEESASDLTVREFQIAGLVADGLTSREIGSQLFISPNTVEYHLKKVFQKVGVRSRIQLVKAIADSVGEGLCPHYAMS